jgi:hypothetical protein
MNWRNACGFLFLGVVMLCLPSMAPGILTPHTGPASGTRELWLLLMGTVNASLGAGAVGWQALKYSGRYVAIGLATANELVPGAGMEPLHRAPARATDY